MQRPVPRVEAVTHGTIDDVAEAVFNVLGVQVH